MSALTTRPVRHSAPLPLSIVAGPQCRLGGTPGFSVILTDEPGAQSWPIAGATFILIPKQPPDAEAAAEALKFFAWPYANGGKMAEELDYAPMPAGVVTAIKKMWANEIKDPGGRPLFAASN